MRLVTDRAVPKAFADPLQGKQTGYRTAEFGASLSEPPKEARRAVTFSGSVAVQGQGKLAVI